MTLKYLITALLTFSLTLPATATQDQTPSTSQLTEYPPTESDWMASAWESFKSPITTKARNPLLLGLGTSAAFYFLRGAINQPFHEKISTNKPLGNTATIGYHGGLGFQNAAYTLGMLGYGFLSSDKDSNRNAIGMLQATIYTSTVTAAIKLTMPEKRPDGDGNDSFPSGHTSLAFAFASYVGCRHSLGWGIAAYSLAAFVGFSRINDNLHYLHDVAAGAGLGTAFGMGTCLAENESSNREKKSKMNMYAAPTPDGGATAGITVNF